MTKRWIAFVAVFVICGEAFNFRLAPPSSFVCVAEYGKRGERYYDPDHIDNDRGSYEQTWSVSGPCQLKVESALSSLVRRDVAAANRRWLIRVDPVEIGQRPRDELPAEADIEVGESESLDLTTIRIVRADAEGRATDDAVALPFRWYDAAIPYDFPEFQDSVSRTAGKLQPQPRERGGYYLNAMGDGRKGRLSWMHTQVGQQPAWYVVEAMLLAPGAVPKHLPQQGWIGDGQARCAETATQAVHSDHLRIDLHDWNSDGLIDLIVGDDFGHLTWWPNLGTKRSPKFEYSRLILDADGQPIDVGIVAAPKLCDWDHDGDLDLLIGTERNRIVWYENASNPQRQRGRTLQETPNSTPSKTERERASALADAAGYWKYRGLVLLDGQPLELPVKPLTRGEPEIFKLDYYPVLEFVDWDGDGDNDLLAGGYITGCVFLYETVAAEPGSPPKIVARGPLEADGKVLNVGHWCASPCAVDLDGDGDLDLLSGQTPMREPTMKAGIRYFENVGSKTSPKLRTAELKTEHLWSITLGSPRAADWDDDGDLDLVIAVRMQLLLLENTGSKSSPKFDKPPVSILPKWGPAPVHADQLLDWDGDGRVDLVNGFIVRLNGGAANPWDWLKTINLLPPGVKIEHRSGRGDDEHSTLLDDFDRDGAIDVLFGDWFGHVWLHRNRGTSAKPDFDLAGMKLMMTNGSPIKVGPIGGDPKTNFNALQGARTVIAAGDYNGDRLRDLIVGDTFGKVRYFEQRKAVGTESQPTSPTFAEGIEIGDLGIRLNVCATDWNQDGKLDVIAGSADGKVQVFLNSPRDGHDSPFAAGFTPKLPPIMQPRVLLGDLNGDGDDDLYFPSAQGTCFVERSFLNHGYAKGIVVKTTVENPPKIQPSKSAGTR
jgi:hypothetical protein